MTDSPRTFATTSDLARGLAAFAAGRTGFLRTPRYRLAYTDQGDPTHPAIVFVHGLSDQAMSFCMLTERLVSMGFRCIGIELAAGDTDGAQLGRYRHSDHAHDLIALLDHLHLDAPAVFAASYGSTVALKLMHLYPERISRTVLQGGFARRPLIPAEITLARAARFLPGRMRDLPGRKKVMARFDAPQFAGAAPEIYDFMLRSSGRTPARAVAQRALVLATLDLRPILSTIRTPIHLIGGNHDPIVPRACEAELERGLPNVRRTELTPCGHYPQYTLPGPTAEIIAEFLREPTRPTERPD